MFRVSVNNMQNLMVSAFSIMRGQEEPRVVNGAVTLCKAHNEGISIRAHPFATAMASNGSEASRRDNGDL